MLNRNFVRISQVAVAIILCATFSLGTNADFILVLWICYALYVILEIYRILYYKKASQNKRMWVEVGKAVFVGVMVYLLQVFVNMPV